MQKAVDYLISHPAMFVVAVIVSVLILFSFFRRVVRTLLVVAAILVLYLAWLQLTGGPTHEAFAHIGQWFTTIFHFLGELFSNILSLLKLTKKEPS
ncbi:MAG: hypothetical protein WCH05_06810 [Chlorobiaceae bacterium]